MTRAEDLLAQGALARREGRLDDALRHFGAAVATARRTGDRKELVKSLEGLGQAERDLGRLEPARLLYEEAVALCREDPVDPLALAHAARHLADIYRHEARPALAEPLYREALALYRGSGGTTPLALANALRPLAILKDDAGDHEEARRIWSEARDLYAAAGVSEGVEESSRRLASDKATLKERVRFEGAQPILSVRDMAASVRYYVEVLGFTNVDWGSDDFTSVNRDRAGIYLCRGGQGKPGTWVWIGVADAAALYEEYRASGAKIVQPPVRRPWALEFQVEDPDGHVLRLGSDPDDDDDEDHEEKS